MTCSTKTKKGAIASTTLSGMVIASLAFGTAAASAQTVPDNDAPDESGVITEDLLDLAITLGFGGENFTEDFPELSTGDWITVSSGGFEPNEEVVILLGNTVLSETVADEDGVVSLNTRIPSYLLSGDFILSIQALDSQNIASIDVVVVGTDLEADDAEVDRSEGIVLNGNGFFPGEGISISLIDENGDVVEGADETADADEDGNFSFLFSAPESLESGTYTLVAVGDESGRTAEIGLAISDDTIGVSDLEDVVDEEEVEEEFGFDGLRTGSLSTVEDGETLELDITATLDGEDVEGVDFDVNDFSISTDNEDDVVDGFSITFNGEGERVITIVHDESGVTATRTVEVLAAPVDDEDETEEDDEDVADEFGFDGLRIDSLGDFEDGGSIDLNIVATLDGEDVDDIEFDADDFTITSDNENDVVDGFTVNLNGEGERVITIVHIESGVTITVPADVPAAEDTEDEDDEQSDISVTLSDSEVYPGQSLVLSAEGFDADEEVTIELNPTLAVVNADEDGNLETVVVIPDDTELGEYEITATGESGAVGSAALSVIADPDEDEDEDEEVVVPPVVSWNSPFPSTVSDGYTATVALLDAEGNDVSDLVTIVSSADDDEIDGNEITFNGFGNRTVDVFLTDFPEVGFSTSVNVLEDEENPVVDDEDAEEGTGGGTDDSETDGNTGTDEGDTDGNTGNGGTGGGSDDGMIDDEWNDFTPGEDDGTVSDDGTVVTEDGTFIEDSVIVDEGSAWDDNNRGDGSERVVAETAIVTDDGMVVADDEFADTTVIASGFVEENPGVAAGLAALLLSGIGAAAFGAHRLMRRTS